VGAEVEDEEAEEGEDGDDVDELLGPRRRRHRETVRLCRLVFHVVVAIAVVVSVLRFFHYESVVLRSTAMAVELRHGGAQRLSLHDVERQSERERERERDCLVRWSCVSELSKL